MSSARSDSTPPTGSTQLNVLYVTPECAPLVKTGGLGDVSASLPPALRAAGIDARLLMPGYPAVLAAVRGAPEAARIVVLGMDVRLLEATLASGVPLLVLDCPPLFDRGGGPYQGDDGADWEDNALRFGVLSRVAALLGGARSPLKWKVDVVHCHDWPAALAPVYLREERAAAASLMTIHNLAFQGVFDFAQVRHLELPQAALGIDGLEFYGRLSFLKGGLVYADAINTVSPTYAREIQTPDLGFGLDGVLRMRSDRLFGVLNGIDTTLWNPESDVWIPRRYSADSLDLKAENRGPLRERMGLASRDDAPVMGMVTRLTHQKGIDLVEDAAAGLMRLGAQLAIVGTGEKHLVGQLRALQSRHGRDIGVFVGFDEGLAHLVEAGSDMFLMPSRFEPCGMNQMYSQRYGTPPIVNATGGLADTVSDGETGFLMRSGATASSLLEAAARAVSAWRDRPRWRSIQRAGMSRDFGWRKAAGEYLAIYQRIKGSVPELTP